MMLFAVVGFFGTVVTLLVVSVALLRTRVVPRWVPGLLVAFLALEFFGTAVSHYASYAGTVCFLLAFGTIARQVLTSPEVWSPQEVVAVPTGSTEPVT